MSLRARTLNVTRSGEGPVLIVGAGPTGLTAAVELARRGVEHRIVDAEPEPVEESRALAVQARTLEVWLDEGLAEAALEAGIEVDAFNAYIEGSGPKHVPIDDMGGPFDRPLILPQDVTERLLVERLEALGGTVERRTELVGLDGSPDEPVARLDGPDGRATSEPSWLVAADGAHSTVRHELDLPFDGVPYPDRFVVADVDLEADLASDELHAWIHRGRLLLIVPLRREGHFRVITTHQPGDDPDVDPDEPPSPGRLQAIVDERSTVPVELGRPRWVSVFRVHCRGVPEYRIGRVLLAGDAAHIHSPAGGQGMNTGIQDAHNLGWKLGLVQKDAAAPGLLDSYHAERHPVGQRLLDTTDRAFQFAASDGFTAHLVRRFVARPLLGTDLLQDRLRGFLSQRNIRYRDSPIVGPGIGSSGPRPGDQMPDGDVIGPGGERARLLEILARNDGHAVLAFTGLGPMYPIRRARDLLDTALDRPDEGVTAGWVVRPGDQRPDPPMLADPGGRLHDTYGRSSPGYEVIRPDGHLGARADGFGLGTFNAYLDRLTDPAP